MRIVLLKEIPEDEDLRRQWNALVERVDQPQVFYTYEWALAVQRAYRATLHPLLYLAYDEQESLCGVAALASDSQGREVSFLCATTGDYCDFISLSETRAAFVQAVFAAQKQHGMRTMALANLPADSATVPALDQAATEQHFFSFARTGYVCTQVVFAPPERRSTEKPELPRKKMVRRFLKAMGREESVRLDHAKAWGVVAPVLPEFMHSHVARFLATGRISNMARAERRVFLTELAKLLSEPGWLALTRMMSGSRAFAWNYGFRFHGTWFWYQPTFDSDLEKYSPGFCLLSKLIEEASEDCSLSKVDFGLGAEEYKDRFANGSRKTLHVTLKASRMQHWREGARYRASEIVKSSPKVEAVTRAIAGQVGKVGSHFKRHRTTASFSWLSKRLRSLLFAETEVFFYERAGSAIPDANDPLLKKLDLNHLATAVIQYVDDGQTITYLLRAAERLQSANAEGFVLVNSAGQILHMAWATAFEGFFLSELKAKVNAPSPDSVMLFDCWTPVAARGHGYYARAVELIARQLQAQGKQPWIFSAATNVSSVRGLEKAGFRRRYSIVSQTILGWHSIKGQPPVVDKVPPAEVSARI